MIRHTLLLATLLSVACTGRPRYFEARDEQAESPGPDDARLIELDLSGGIPEGASSGFIQIPAKRTYTGLIRAIEQALADPTTAGVYTRLGTQSLGFARSEELGELLARFRADKRPVICHADSLDNATAWLALRGCTRIWLSPAGSMDTVGIAAELVHFKPLLDRLRVEAEILSVGKYKSGAEPLTREEPSEATRESLGATLSSMRQSWLDGAEQGRPGQAIPTKLEDGPYSPEEGLKVSLIDSIGFESDARREAQRLSKTRFSEKAFGARSSSSDGLGVGELIRILTGSDDGSAGHPRVAVVTAEGAIGMDSSGPLGGGNITAKSMNRTLRRLRDDPSVKAVVVRIDSPGGSPLASDLIWHEMMELRKKKPIITSVGSMAASGGYYIACAAHTVVAPRTSIVGSIGVFGGKITLGPALKEVGINTFVVPANTAPGAAERATYLSPFTPWDEATKRRVEANIRSIYDLFVERVAKARKLSREAVHAQAQGRIWSGEQGKERGLVDELGGLARALEIARQRAGLPPDAPVSVEGLKESLLDLLLLGEDATEEEIREAFSRLPKDHPLLSRLPRDLQVYLRGIASLASGETVVATLPVALTFR